MDKTQREIRYDEYCEKYAEQLRYMRYITSLETDNEHIRLSAKDPAATGRDKRRAKKLIKINDKDIQKYKRILETLPEAPEFR